MDAFKSLLGPFGGSSMLDGVKLVVLGGAVETARRGASSAWSSFVNSFYLTTHLTEEDYPYDWVLNWLEKQPAWGRSREFETTTRNVTVGSALKRAGAEEDEDMDPEDDDDQAAEDENELVPGKQRVKVMFTPTYDTTHTIFYRGHYLRVKRSKKADGSDVEMLSISVIARSNRILKQLVLQAKREYEADAIHRIQIYFADSHGSWRWTDSRHKRPISSIILNPGVVDMLLNDTRDFLKSEKWYADRGIPFRRGYLLWGVPGAGKTSLIHAIAGELQLDIYCLSLSSSWISDSTLTTLMGRVPARCILLLEDLDAAFTRSVTREEGSGTGTTKKDGKDTKETDAMSDTNSLSLSGLLNALDGVAASEGRLLFATTNHLDRLDPALSRPGRMDVWIEFRNASKWQAEGLFRNFFPIATPEVTQPEAPVGGATDGEDRDLTPEEEAEIAGFAFPEVPEQEAAKGAHVRARTTSYAGPAAASAAALPTPVATPPRTRVASTAGTWTPTSSPLAASSSASTSASASSSSKGAAAAAVPPTAYAPPPPSSAASLAHSAPPMDAAKLARLAKQFADAIPEDEFSVAALQGYLLKNKSKPEAAASEAGAWVIQERELREKLKREKEEKEKKEREEREKRRKEREEKEREEKAKEQEKKREEEAKKEKEAAEQEKTIQAKKAEEAASEKAKTDAAAAAAEAVRAKDIEMMKAAAEQAKAEASGAVTPTVVQEGEEGKKDEAWVALKKEQEQECTNKPAVVEEVKVAA